MRTNARLLGTALIAFALLATGVSANALHDVTHKGTVVAVDAQSIKVSVINDKTKKPETITTYHDKETKFLRGDKLVSFADAKIRVKERITVTYNNDDDANVLDVVRLDPFK